MLQINGFQHSNCFIRFDQNFLKFFVIQLQSEFSNPRKKTRNRIMFFYDVHLPIYGTTGIVLIDIFKLHPNSISRIQAQQVPSGYFNLLHKFSLETRCHVKVTIKKIKSILPFEVVWLHRVQRQTKSLHCKH